MLTDFMILFYRFGYFYKMTFRFIVLFIFVVFSTKSQSVFFEKIYGGRGADNAEVVIEIAGGDIFMGGYSDSLTQNGSYDACLTRLDKFGNLKWIKHYASVENDYGLYMTRLRDGSFFMVGEVNTGNGNGIDALLLKLDTAGNLIWRKSFGGAGAQSLQYVDTIVGGEIIACGYAASPTGDNEVLVVKMDTSGNIVWQKLHGGNQTDYADGVHQTPDGGYILSAVTSSFGGGSTDGWLLRLNSLGDTLWTRTSGDQYAGGCQGTFLLTNGDYLLYGEEEIFSGSGFNFWMERFDSIGVSKWKKNFGGNGTDALFTVREDNQGNIFAAGYSNSFNFGAPLDLILIKTDSAGNQQWRKTYGGSGVDICYDMIKSQLGGFILTGIFTDPVFQSQFYLLHLDTIGTLIQSVDFDNQESGLSLFPVPSGNEVHLKRNKSENEMSIALMNTFGQIVSRYILEKGMEEIIIPVNELEEGIYVIQLRTTEIHCTKKLIISR
jgi:hypothetical protein